MAIEYGYFNAMKIGGVFDRTYDADHVNYQLRRLISDGVYANPSTNLQVVASTEMNVTIKKGGARVDCKWFEADADESLAIAASDVSLPRIDRVVLRLDFEARTIEYAVKKGTLSSTPSAPIVEQTELIKELGLATIIVDKGITSISQANITDTRANKEVCGFITGLIESVDTSTLFLQYQAAYEADRASHNMDFETWFNQVTGTIKPFGKVCEYKQLNTVAATQAKYSLLVTAVENVLMGLDSISVYKNGMKLNASEYTVVNDTLYPERLRINFERSVVLNDSFEVNILKNQTDSDAASGVTQKVERFTFIKQGTSAVKSIEVYPNEALCFNEDITNDPSLKYKLVVKLMDANVVPVSGVYKEWILQFTCPNDTEGNFEMIMDNIVGSMTVTWITPPEFKPGYTYVISIANGIGMIAGVKV